MKRARVLGSGPHTPTKYFWEYHHVMPLQAILKFPLLLVKLVAIAMKTAFRCFQSFIIFYAASQNAFDLGHCI